MMISGAEARLAASPGLGRDELAQLQRATVAIVGTGVLGGQLAHHLGLLGVGLVLIDGGRVEPENLGNQGFPAASLGEAKSVVRARHVIALNPDCAVRPLVCRIEDLGLGALADVQLIATGLDSRASRARVNEIAFRLGLPWVDAAVDGSGRWLRGTVTAYVPRRPESPCYLCRYDARDVDAIRREGRAPGCPSWRQVEAPVTAPTLQASAFGGIVAGFQALHATRALLGRDNDLVGRQLIIECDGTARTRTLTVERQPRCLFNHRRLDPLRAAPGSTVGDLLACAATDLDAEPDCLSVHGRTLIHGLACPRCGATRDIVRIAQACTDDDVRCDCQSATEMAPTAMSERLAGADARRLAGVTWDALGVPVADVVTAAAGHREAHYIVNGRAIV